MPINFRTINGFNYCDFSFDELEKFGIREIESGVSGNHLNGIVYVKQAVSHRYRNRKEIVIRQSKIIKLPETTVIIDGQNHIVESKLWEISLDYNGDWCDAFDDLDEISAIEVHPVRIISYEPIQAS